MIPQDLLEILRCPHCVTGDTRRPGDDPGQLDLVKDTWLVCREPDCNRKYPIVDDIPVMLIEAAGRWISTPAAQLPTPPPADAAPGSASPNRSERHPEETYGSEESRHGGGDSSGR